MVKNEEKQLVYAYWLTTHKEKLKKIGIIIFIIVDLLLLIYGILGFVDYYLIDKQDQNIFQNWSFYNLTNYRNRIKPLDLQILDTTILEAGIGKYDLIAFVKNPNDQWVAPTINYRFLINNSTDTPIQTSFILADEKKYLMILAYDSPERIKEVKLIIDQVGWRRLSTIDNYQPIEIKISEEKLTPLSDLVQSQTNIQRLSFKAVNNSIYNLWEVGFQVAVIGSQNKVINANYLKINNFLAFEEKLIEINLFSIIGRPRKIEILPETNIFDESNFKETPVETVTAD